MSGNPGLDEYRQLMVPNYAPANLIPVRGQGARVWLQDGRELIDFGGGIAVNSLGHCHPELIAVLRAQSEKLWHVSNVVANEPAIELARALCAASFAERVFFCNSGAEANEAALKLARRHASLSAGPHKHEIVSFSNSFHGRTLFTVSVGGQPKYSEHFGPLPAGILHLPYNDIAAAEQVIGDSTCAVIVEPIQGEGGVMPADTVFLQRLRALCDAHGAALIFDEVQTGVGRTGSFFAYMDVGVVPDILTTAKGLGGGFPIGAMLTTASWAGALTAGTHGTTFGGNPLACAVARRVVEIVSDGQFLACVRERETQFRSGLQELIQRHPEILSQVRGKGLLLGVVTADAFRGRAAEIVTAGQAAGVWCLAAGADVVRFAPPLVITADDVRDGLQRLGAALETLAAKS